MGRLDSASLASPSSSAHPLSPGSTPQGARRGSSAHGSIANGAIRQDYFGSASTSLVRSARRRTVVDHPSPGLVLPPQKAALSPTPSRKSGDVFGGIGEEGSDGGVVVLDSLTKAEMAVVEERFDLMDDDELERYLTEYRKHSSGDVLSTPRAARRARNHTETDSPLFPPSPPTEAELVQPDHPLRILSRAVREMQEAVKRVQAENARLQEELQRYRPAPQSTKMSLSDGLEEALSTSLTSPSPLAQRISSVPAPAPASQTQAPARPKSPTPSIAPSITPSIASQDSRIKKDIRSTWTATLWGWGGKKNGRRRDSSTSHAASQVDLPIPTEEEEWREGDGGSPPSFVAIFLATRLITPDPSSILHIDTQPLVAQLAHTLVSTARDENIAPRDPPGRRRSRETRSRATSTASSLHPPPSAAPESNKGYDALATTASIGRTLLSTVSGATLRSMRGDETIRPALIARASSAQLFPTTAVVKPVVTVEPIPNAPLPSVEMASIVAEENQPPTVLLSRQNLGSFFQANKSGRMHTATRFQGSDPPLTDRYGFIYDIQHASMLKDASAAGAPAPASLSGLIPDDDAWVERKRPKAESIRSVTMDRQSSSSSNTPPDPSTSTSNSTAESHRHRGSISLKLNPSPARPITGKDTQPVSSRGASSLQPSNSPSIASAAAVPNPASSPAVSRLTVSSLLDQLTEIHDRQQDERKKAWDKWMRKRSNNGVDKTGWSGDMIGIGQMGLAKDADDWKGFAKLVRRGIPLAYRAKIWAECSGATDALVPGEYAEILSVHAHDRSPVQVDIEKDVTRTFPSNVYFGGDGHGVPKLRRVLLAYAWRNPNVGYCQGMNMLAATLLLTHTEEEQAFWVLCCMIDRMLPQDYYTPTLLGSRAVQLVLQDLVTVHLPKIAGHLGELGVDLASITFGWFLSLFTDCLPVETLFCVWDLFFVEGHDCLFRVALAILKLNEADLLACESAGDLFALVGGMTGRLWAAEKLIQLQHAYRPLITHTDIVQRSAAHLGALQPE